MMKSFRKLVSAALAAVMFLSLCPSALAADAPNEKCVTFYGLSALEEGESMQYSLTQDGEEVQVGIKRVPAYTRAAGRTWQVWYKALGVSVEFYMTVSNNKVTSAYDYSISLVGASYEDADLMHTSIYGKLTYTYKAPAGLAAFTCWLKGEVTGEDDEINVTWQM